MSLSCWNDTSLLHGSLGKSYSAQATSRNEEPSFGARIRDLVSAAPFCGTLIYCTGWGEVHALYEAAARHSRLGRRMEKMRILLACLMRRKSRYYRNALFGSDFNVAHAIGSFLWLWKEWSSLSWTQNVSLANLVVSPNTLWLLTLALCLSQPFISSWGPPKKTYGFWFL